MKQKECIKFFKQLGDEIQQQFADRGLVGEDIIVFYAGTLAQILEWAISDTGYPTEDIKRILKNVSSTLKESIKEGWELRKKDEKKPKVD